jgi:EAL domain-containing protein (putative c-di-GMP-specific phosphodiesterase class I)
VNDLFASEANRIHIEVIEQALADSLALAHKEGKSAHQLQHQLVIDDALLGINQSEELRSF